MKVVQIILISVGAWFGVAIILSLIFGGARGTEYQTGFYFLNFINFAFWVIFIIVRISKINKNASEVNTSVSSNAPIKEPSSKSSVIQEIKDEQPSSKEKPITYNKLNYLEVLEARAKETANVSPEKKALQDELNRLKLEEEKIKEEEKKAEEERKAQEEIAKKKKEEEKEIERLKKEIDEAKVRISKSKNKKNHPEWY